MTTPGVHALRVPPTAPTQRVDRWVAEATGLSRSHVQKLISAGNLTADGVALKANAVVGPGTALRLVVPEPQPLDLAPAPDIPLRVVHEDADLLIIRAGPSSTRSSPTAGPRRSVGSPASSGQGSSIAWTATRAG
jgi:23S rRNA-/tRNA-specific pseudouridylate synthase